MLPLLYGKGRTATCDEDEARSCYPGCLNSTIVKGKIVVCDDPDGKSEARYAGAIGVLTPIRVEISVVTNHPWIGLNSQALETLISYLNSTRYALLHALFFWFFLLLRSLMSSVPSSQQAKILES